MAEPQSFFQAYQTIITGAVGFTGVILTLVVSARAARKLETHRRTMDAAALRIALVEELRMQRDILQRTADSLNDAGFSQIVEEPLGTHHGGYLPLLRARDVFDSSVNRIGLLTQDEVRAVFAAYIPLRALTPKLQLISATFGNAPRLASEGWVWLSSTAAHIVEGMHASYIPAIETAIVAIEAEASKPSAPALQLPFKGLFAILSRPRRTPGACREQRQ